MDERQVVDGVPVVAFADPAALRAWLETRDPASGGVWVRLARAGSGVPSVTFLDLLDAGLCFGWSESTRRAGDDLTYLQRFSPRRRRGTASARNRDRAARLIEQGLMTERGLAVLDLA
jgi:uncharacterized protein YdeI (YjbR/CyaY-like superfamily)